MSATATNGKPSRKQLSDQLDRLDSILDTIAEGLPVAKTEACREGARAAVRDAIVEILTNPDLRALLAGATSRPAPQPKKPSFWSRVKEQIAVAREAIGGVVKKVKVAVLSPLRSMIDAAGAIGTVGGEVLPWKRVLVVGAVFGAAVGVTCLVMPHTVAAMVGAVGAATTSVAVQVGMWLKKAARCFGLMG
jgi:hypothetical protein